MGDYKAALRRRALQQIAAAGRRGIFVERGWESVTQQQLVNDGMIEQVITRGGRSYKFTITADGKRELEATNA